MKNAKSGHKTRKIINYSNVFAKMKKSKFLVRGMLGVIFSCSVAPCGACTSFFALLLYSKGFALFPFKNGVEIAAVEGVAASIDRHAVPCCGPGTGGGVLEPARDATVARVYFYENHSVFG